METLYSSVADKLSDSGDKNFCVPVAVAFVMDKDVEEINTAMVEGLYRKKGNGVSSGNTKRFFEDNNVEFLDITDKVIECGGRTVRSAVDVLDPAGTYYVETAGHALAIRKGVAEDWTANRLHRVKRVLQIGSLEDPILTVIRQDDRAYDLLADLEAMAYEQFALSISGPVIRTTWWEQGERVVCYVGQSRGEGILSFTKTNGLDDRLSPSNFSKETKRHYNYRYPSLEDAMEALNVASGGS